LPVTWSQGQRVSGGKAAHSLLHLELTGPECFVAIGVETKNLPTLIDQLLRVFFSAAEKLGFLVSWKALWRPAGGTR
jgi:hypothetical protein